MWATLGLIGVTVYRDNGKENANYTSAPRFCKQGSWFVRVNQWRFSVLALHGTYRSMKYMCLVRRGG